MPTSSNSSINRIEEIKEVKSRLLPLHPIVALLERAIEALPRTKLHVSLHNAHLIAVEDEKTGSYRATGNDPWFDLKTTPSFGDGGWFYIEAALVRNNGNRDANIYVEVGNGVIESITLPIPTNLRGSVREIFYLPPRVTSVHWSPTAAPGFFSQSALIIHKVCSLESFYRRFYRVLFDLWRFRKQAVTSRGGLRLFDAFFNLQNAYRCTAMIRIQGTLGNDYQAFLEKNDLTGKKHLDGMFHQIANFERRPLLTIMVPLKDPIVEFLAKMLDSIGSQIYPDWELLFVADATIGKDVIALIRQREASDGRIKLILEIGSPQRAGLLNCAVSSSSSEFCCVVDQHDVIHPVALFYFAQQFSRYPGVEFVYSDEDSIDETGKRFAPIFKPDWNPDLFLSQYYTASLSFYRQSLLMQIGGYRDGYVGAEEYDLALRCLPMLKSEQIRHIPKVLYSRRMSAKSVAGAVELLKAKHEAGFRALQEHTRGIGARVTAGPAPLLYRVHHPLPGVAPLVSMIIPTRDKLKILSKCVESILEKTDYVNWEMLIVDNQSEEPQTLAYFDEIQKDSRIKVLKYNDVFNYSSLNNFAVRFAKGEVLALINNDVEVISPDWLTEMVSHAVRPEIGAVGAKLLYENGMVQHAGVILGIGGVAAHVHKYLKSSDLGYCSRASITQNLSAVTGACLVVKKEIYEQVRGLNEADLAVAFNDIDFCLKVREAGYRNLYTPYALLYHHESLSRGHDDTLLKQEVFEREFAYMKKTWNYELKSDPAYNPNLTLEFENFSFA